MKAARYIYVMDFKLKSTSKSAIQQIRDKEYTLPFLSDGREVIILIGAAFSAKTVGKKMDYRKSLRLFSTWESVDH
ncbi:MAG: hypothetical protein HDR88_07805 [Bacteroides sp.]|nr:hypothetical protein [Bacteroides sp.]